MHMKSPSPQICWENQQCPVSILPTSKENTFGPFMKSFDIYLESSKLCIYIATSSLICTHILVCQYQ